MKDYSKSSFVFQLINESGILASEELSDEVFDAFCKIYIQKANERDTALVSYLRNSPNLFRCHLPFSKWVVSVTFDIVWYYDEIVLNDPILSVINWKFDLEIKKNYLRDWLKLLVKNKSSIDGGFILLAGDLAIPSRRNLFSERSKAILNSPNVLSEFEKHTLMLSKPSPINDNPNDNITQVDLSYEGIWGELRTMGMSIPEHVMNSGKLGGSVNFNFETPFNVINKERIIELGKQEMLDSAKVEYAKDIAVILETITNAESLNTPVLLYRDVDHIVAQQYENTVTKSAVINKSIYECAVPFIKGIEPEHLFSIRSEIPEAFVDFRFFLRESFLKASKSTSNPNEIKYLVDQDVKSLLRRLETEIKSAKRKWQNYGIVAPASVVAVGSISLNAFGLDVDGLFSGLISSTGFIKTYLAYSDLTTEKEKAELNPVYFLWKVNQNQQKLS